MVDLKQYNTFGISALCKELIEITDPSQLVDAIEKKLFFEPFLILGGGSNFLFTHDLAARVFYINTKGIQWIAENSTYVYLKVAAGEEWDDLVNYCVEHNYYGLENLAGIPGKVGSSAVQNIGAYGMEAKDRIFQVHTLRLDNGRKVLFTNEDCRFGYRDSIFKREVKDQYVITEVVFQLYKIKSFNLEYGALKELAQVPDKVTLAGVRDEVLRIRNSKLPSVKEIGSAGSFFKNPVVSAEKWNQLKAEYPNLIGYPVANGDMKLAAGQLIDLAGWKGYREGDAGVYPKQALILVNYGTATGQEILQLAEKIKESVVQKYGVYLEPEVIIQR
ncbi:MAG TPA: UDP-N-acetylmuramate dehydrogenase [Bacteroidales bacterium]|nr:UDP-N-acetylmuramate dehydrogenase [Bacteroidales bacterium]